MNPFHRILCGVVGLLLGCSLAVAGPALLVDEIHGLPGAADLAERWPDCQVDALTRDDFPIETVLASGEVMDDEAIVVSVPPGAPMLYGRFDCPDGMGQYPFILLHGPDGDLICEHHRGGLHLENPPAGEYTIEYSTWDPEPITYTIGTGPPVLTAGLVSDYDVVVRIHENTSMLFQGVLPEYSDNETAVLEQHVAAGGGNLLVRQPLVEIALKPIIDLTAPRDLACDVTVGMAGDFTYLEPDAVTRPLPGGGEAATWRDVRIEAGATTRLLYEGALSPAHHLLEVVATDGGLQLTSHAETPLREAHLARHVDGDRWQLAVLPHLRPGATATVAATELRRPELLARLRAALHAGGLAAGLDAAQMEEFVGRYRWDARVAAAADGTGCWTAFFRVDQSVCDAVLPLIADPEPASRTRVLWFWVTGVPDAPASAEPWPPLPASPVLANPIEGTTPAHLAEYGVIRQSYPDRETGPAPRDLDWLGWIFHDDAHVLDPTDNAGQPDLPWLHVPGLHPDADLLTDGLAALGHVKVGGIVAPAEQAILCADDDAYTDDGFFLPGSFPRVVVARDIGQGRAAAVASRRLLDSDGDDNRALMRRLVSWLAGLPTDVRQDLPRAVLTRLTAYPNPFNPRTEIALGLAVPAPVTVTVHDLAGRRMTTLLDQDLPAGDHRLTWTGADHRGRDVAAGVYLVRVRAGGEVLSQRLTLVD
jgi:hypothetical protein